MLLCSAAVNYNLTRRSARRVLDGHAPLNLGVQPRYGNARVGLDGLVDGVFPNCGVCCCAYLWTTSRARVNNTCEHRVSCGAFPFSDTEGAIRTHCRTALMITRYRGQLLGSAVMKLTRYTAVLTESYRRDGTDRHARPQPRRDLGNQGIFRMKRGIHRAIITVGCRKRKYPRTFSRRTMAISVCPDTLYVSTSIQRA